MRRNTQHQRMPGYHETLWENADSVHHTKSIVPVPGTNVKDILCKNRRELAENVFTGLHGAQNPLTTLCSHGKIITTQIALYIQSWKTADTLDLIDVTLGKVFTEVLRWVGARCLRCREFLVWSVLSVPWYIWLWSYFLLQMFCKVCMITHCRQQCLGALGYVWQSFFGKTDAEVLNFTWFLAW